MDLDTTNVIAIQMELPAKMSWAANAGKNTSSGKTLNDLVYFTASNKLETATLSLSFLMPIELGQGAHVELKG